MANDPDLEFSDWGPPLRIEIDHAPVWLFAQSLLDDNPIWASPAAARAAGLPGIPTPPTFPFVMTHGAARPDLQPPGSVGVLMPAPLDGGFDLPADGMAEVGLFLHGEQQFEYHRTPLVGDVLEGRMRVSRPVSKPGRRGEMRLTYLETEWRDVTTGDPVVTSRIISVYLPGG